MHVRTHTLAHVCAHEDKRHTHQQREPHSCPGAKHALPQIRAANQARDPNKESAYEMLTPWLAEWFWWEHVSAVPLYVPVYHVLLTENQTVTRGFLATSFSSSSAVISIKCHQSFSMLKERLPIRRDELYRPVHAGQAAFQHWMFWPATNGPCSICSTASGSTVAPLAVLRISLAEASYVWPKKRSETYETGGTAGYKTKIPPHQLHHSCFLHVLRSMLCRKQTGHLPGWCSSLSPLQMPGFSQNALSSHEK